MTYTGEHFRDLYNITKEEGLVKALKFDVERTCDDLGDLLEGLFITGTLVVLTPYVIYRACKMYKEFNKKQSNRKQK